MRASHLLLLVLPICGGLTLLPTPTPADPAPSPHLKLGNPSGATASITNVNNFLMQKPQFALSYSKLRGSANWVGWRVRLQDLGSIGRSEDFRGDLELPSVFFRVNQSAFAGSGYDRGHMCPSGDRTASRADNSATFVMTNMLPQAPDNNRKVWARLEDYCRELVRAGNVLYVTAGGFGTQGTLAGGDVVVPTHTWKVIVVSDAEGAVTADTRVIAVEMPNRNGIGFYNWRKFRTSVDHLEDETGNDFLPNVPVSLQSELEAKVDEVED